MISSIISRLVILVFGTLYPAYASYKAVRTKNLKEYVKWMMYWIVFALFTCTETFTDVFLSWFPFYYEVKIVLVLWLLSPATKGSSILYRKFVHPALCRREQEIDEYIAKAKDQGYHTVLNLGTKGVNYATTVIMQTAIKNFNLPSPEQGRARSAIRERDVTDYHESYEDLEYQRTEDNDLPGIVEIVELDSAETQDLPVGGEGDVNDPDYEPTSARSRGNVVRKRKVQKEKRPRSKSRGRRTRSQTAIDNEVKGGGGLVQQIRKSYSLSDLSECEPREERSNDEADDVLTEPRVIKRGVKSGYNTRRSASESNSRSPMFFPEVDVDLRATRAARTDEPDFSHIKSTEDISSGYSSADNSASLTRTASLGASARAKARARTTVTTIKRPQAAEENEVIIEELHDDDTFDYANMPALVNAHSPLYLSHTDPPFIYRYVGDQVNIIQVLGNYPLITNSNNETNNPDLWDQKEATDLDASPKTNSIVSEQNQGDIINVNNLPNKHNINKENVDVTKDDVDVSKNISEVTEHNVTIVENNEEIINRDKLAQNFDCINIEATSDVTPTLEMKTNETASEIIEYSNTIVDHLTTDDPIESTSLDTSINDNDSADSDDEASFGTPDDSPKSKRKSPKGKYGKGKAPPPPKLDLEKIDSINTNEDEKMLDSVVSTTSQESLADIMNVLPNTSFKETGKFKGLQVVNPIAEKKRRHKSKSPARIPKGSSSGISKLLQLPSKLAFWNKAEDRPKDNISTSSEGGSRKSSSIEKTIDEFQSCNNLANISNDTIEKIATTNDFSFKDATDFENEAISLNIIEKSDALKKLIEAKLESHPEYKFVSLHEQLPTTASKSTDV